MGIRYTQPQRPVSLDRDNPLGSKVVYASTLAGVAYDAATGKTGVNTAAVAKATPNGMALNFNGSSAYITLPTTNLVAAYPLTVACWFEKTTSVSQVIYSLNGSGYSAIAGYTPANLNLSINVGSSPILKGYPFISIPAGWNHLVVVHFSGSFTMYLNGVDVTAATTGSQNWGQPAAGNHSIGQRLGGATPKWFNGGIQDFIVFNGALSAAEAQQVYQNPWQIFKSLARRIPIPYRISHDASSNSGPKTALSTYTFNRTVAGSDRFLAVNVHILTSGQTVTSVVDDSGGTPVNLTFIGGATQSSVGRIEQWGLINPALGTKSVQVNLSGAVNSTSTASSYTGVHQTTPTEAFNSAFATNGVSAADASVIVTTIADNCLVHAACISNDDAITAGQTSRNNVSLTAVGSGANEDFGSVKTPAGAVTMSYTGIAGLKSWAIAGYAIRPAAATGGTAAALATDAVAQASAAAALTTSSGLSASAQDVASAAAALSTGIPLQGAAAAQASATAALGIPLAIEAPTDRGTLDLANCSITPNGLTPQINIKNRYIGDANTTGARFTFGRLTGVNGMTPVIKVDRSNMEINASAKFLWSTTGLKGSWTPFANFTSDASFFTVSHNVAFTSDTIYFASNNPWPVGYTLPWIQSLEASGFVSYAPSGGISYQFETRSATTNGATAGVGDTIAAQPLYSFKISSGAGNAPDGLPKRSIVLMAGTHAAEDAGNYALEGAVAFLTSADAQAVVVRNWFNIYVYPLTATAGRSGGGQRNDFENTLKTTDVNREWPNGALETVNKHKTAIQTDAGSTLAMLLDFHGTHLSSEGAYDWYNGLNQATWTNAIRTYWAALEIRSNGTAGLASKWSVDSKAARHGVSPEYPYHNDEVMASLLAYGENHMRAVAYLAAAGEFNGLTGSATAQATATADLTTGGGGITAAALSVSTASGALTSGIPLGGVAVSIANASGALTAQVQINAAALAQAVSSAMLSSGIIMTAAAVAQAAAQGTLTTALNLLASAAAQASAAASLGGGGQLAANAAAAATASGSLTIQITLSGQAVGIASSTGDLTVPIQITAAALAQAIATGGLTSQIQLSVNAAGQATAAGQLSGIILAADPRFTVAIPARGFTVYHRV